MSQALEDIKDQLNQLSSPERAKSSAWFFKTGPGQYGENDQFIGVTVPNQRKVAKQFHDLPLPKIEKLLQSPIHEHRLTALLILIDQFRRGDEKIRKSIYDFYISHTKYINNWDLVDLSAEYIVGPWLEDKSYKLNALRKLTSSSWIWDRRIALLSSFHYIKLGKFDEALTLCELLLQDKHDLIQKAVGWMLREIGNRDIKTEEEFLSRHYKVMPRTALRYAIEKFPEIKRKQYLSKN